MWFCFLGERDDRETGRVEEEEKRRGDVLNEERDGKLTQVYVWKFWGWVCIFRILSCFDFWGRKRVFYNFFIIFLNIANVKNCESFKFYGPSYEKVKKKSFNVRDFDFIVYIDEWTIGTLLRIYTKTTKHHFMKVIGQFLRILNIW